ncbi:uncharacterized protein LOC143229786 [Tachypleus tridentatus]|uniref:uncharacterized protein LOC143229786 n=1 Tax=Tachypleus tridentatus TaxID=6853 RepID=UPI003FD4784F
MGCGATKNAEVNADTMPSEVEVETPVQPDEVVTSVEPEAKSEESESIVKKHPPKKLQRLEEQPQTILTAKELEANELLPQEPKQEGLLGIPEETPTDSQE